MPKSVEPKRAFLLASFENPKGVPERYFFRGFGPSTSSEGELGHTGTDFWTRGAGVVAELTPLTGRSWLKAWLQAWRGTTFVVAGGG